MFKIFLMFFYLIYTCSAEEYKKCNSSLLNSCPDKSMCVVDMTNNNTIGECHCRDNYIFNNNKNKNNTYCIDDHNNSYNKNKNSVDSGNSRGATVSASHDSDNSIEPPDTHHIVGGILIPILFVFLMCGMVYGYKKFHINKRLRNIFVRKQRPTYEDVVMGNDLDDPPLI